MTYAITQRGWRFSLSEFAAQLVASVKENRARRAIYNRTLDELRMMSDRDLADIGIARVQIEDIAFEAAYGK